jgi:hypothetical protein
MQSNYVNTVLRYLSGASVTVGALRKKRCNRNTNIHKEKNQQISLVLLIQKRAGVDERNDRDSETPF